MSDLVLVRYDAGDEYVIAPRGRAFAEVNALKVLDESAYERSGRPVAERREPKRRANKAANAEPKTSAASAAEKKKAKAATSTKEN